MPSCSFLLKPSSIALPMFYLQHYQRDADGLYCRLMYPVEKTGSIEYTISVPDFKDSKFHVIIAYHQYK